MEYVKFCRACGKEFIGGKLAKYCSSACRLKDFRAREKQAAIKRAEPPIFEEIRKLAGYEAVTDYETFALIRAVIQYAETFVPEKHSRWWFCDRCKMRVQTDMPEEMTCPCGKLAAWHILSTKP